MKCPKCGFEIVLVNDGTHQYGQCPVCGFRYKGKSP